MSLTYTTWVSSISNLTSIGSGDPNFQAMLPNCIDDVEQRLYRDLDLLNTVTRDGSTAFTPGLRTFTVPLSVSSLGTSNFYVIQQINAITPAGQGNADLGTRNPLTPTSKEMIDAMWPSSLGSSIPTYYAMLTQDILIVGPVPDQAYQVEVVGTVRPAPLSPGNPVTLLSFYFPDLLIAASMVFAAGYMKNFGAAVDDPKAGITWESHLQTMLTSAKTEEARKKFMSEAWSDKTPAMAGAPRA